MPRAIATKQSKQSFPALYYWPYFDEVFILWPSDREEYAMAEMYRMVFSLPSMRLGDCIAEMQWEYVGEFE